MNPPSEDRIEDARCVQLVQDRFLYGFILFIIVPLNYPIIMIH